MWNFAKSFGTLMFSPVWPCLVSAWRLCFPQTILQLSIIHFHYHFLWLSLFSLHFTSVWLVPRICLVLLSSWSYFHKIEDSQRGNEAISGNCEIDRSVLFLLWTSAPLSLFTLWPSPENSSLVSQYNLISRQKLMTVPPKLPISERLLAPLQMILPAIQMPPIFDWSANNQPFQIFIRAVTTIRGT